MIARKWQTLGVDPIAHWNAYAVSHKEIDWTSNPKRLSGMNWYVRCNLRLLDLAKPLITEPPSIPAPNPLESFAATNGSGSSALTWTPTGDWGDYVDIFVFGPHSAGVAAKIERASHNVYTQGPSGTVTIASLQPGTYTFWARVIYQDNGLASTWVSASALVS
jgi:hypothetical protein